MAPLDLSSVVDIDGSVVLRPETQADRGFTRALYATQRAAELAMTPWDEATKAAFVDQQFAAQHAHLCAHRPAADYWIVMREGVPIGRMYIDRSVDPWRLAELALIPDETGRGLGAALVRWAIAEARGGGASGIDLHVAIDNVRGADFYRRLGFVAAASSFASHHRLLHDLADVS